jgi:hypothetical protein
MKAGLVLAVIGVIVVLVGVANHFARFVKVTHGDLIIAVVGIIIFLIGAAMVMMTTRRAPARAGSSRL